LQLRDQIAKTDQNLQQRTFLFKDLKTLLKDLKTLKNKINFNFGFNSKILPSGNENTYAENKLPTVGNVKLTEGATIA